MKERYSKVSRRMWNDKRFRRLSAPQPNAQTLWQRLLTGPELGVIPGVFQAWEGGLAQALGWPLEAFRKAFAEVLREDLAKADWEAGLVWVPKAVKHNEPQSPNVVIGWAREWTELPECKLKDEAFRHLKAYVEGLPEGFQKAFRKAFAEVLAKTSPNQEQEQEDLLEEEDPRPDRLKASEPAGGSFSPPDPLAYLSGRAPAQREDVQRLHERWKELFGYKHHTFRGVNDLDAVLLARMLDTYGEQNCLLVLEHAPNDDWVRGKVDDQRHDSIRYLFDNHDAFNRILRAAEQAEPEQQDRRRASEVIAAAKASEVPP